MKTLYRVTKAIRHFWLYLLFATRNKTVISSVSTAPTLTPPRDDNNDSAKGAIAAEGEVASELDTHKTTFEYTSILSLLNDLDYVFSCMSKVRRRSTNDGARMIRRWGVHIGCADASASFDVGDMAKYFKAYGMPSMFSVMVPALHKDRTADDGDALCPQFVYALKHARNENVQSNPNEQIYEIGIVFLAPKKKNGKHDVDYTANSFVGVDKDTYQVRALKVWQNRPKTVVTRAPKASGADKIPQPKGHKITIPHHVLDIVRLPSNKLNGQSDEEFVVDLFKVGLSTLISREMTPNIYVKKNGMRATFNVPNDDWKRFFKDRVTAVAGDGKRKRIFHSVSAHVRKTKNGRQNVRTHYRGERSFSWNGYSINIVMQGLHGVSQMAFGASAYSDDDIPGDGFDLMENSRQTDRLERIFESNGRHNT